MLALLASRYIRKVADMMERRRLDILYAQKTKWKGSKAKNMGGGCKLFYNCIDRTRNGVGIILAEEYVTNVLNVVWVSDRIMRIKLEVRGVRFNLVSAYTPQVRCEEDEKNILWNELDDIM